MAAAMVWAPLHAAPAHTTATTVYKCAAAEGVIYQDTPCAPGTELRNFATDPPGITIVPGATTPAPAPSSGTGAARTPKASGRDVVVPVRARTSGDVAERRFIRVGMTATEVVARIGRPDMSAREKRGTGSRWSYLPRAGDPGMITTLIIVDGRVADVERKLVQ
jgi:hypothetical protein